LSSSDAAGRVRAYPRNECIAEAVREAGQALVILFGLRGHGHFDMSAYDAHLASKLEDLELGPRRIEQAVS
jgi:tryptophan synthase beta chain